ncbi:MAG: hypothetical protein WCK86_18960 [Planctomycetia bacterium]
MTKSKPGTNPKEVAAKIWQLAPPILIHPQQKNSLSIRVNSRRYVIKNSPQSPPTFRVFRVFRGYKKTAFPIRAIRAIRGSKTKPANSPPIMVKKPLPPIHTHPKQKTACPFV